MNNYSNLVGTNNFGEIINNWGFNKPAMPPQVAMFSQS
jgi:hypothetical protein